MLMHYYLFDDYYSKVNIVNLNVHFNSGMLCNRRASQHLVAEGVGQYNTILTTRCSACSGNSGRTATLQLMESQLAMGAIIYGSFYLRT